MTLEEAKANYDKALNDFANAVASVARALHPTDAQLDRRREAAKTLAAAVRDVALAVHEMTCKAAAVYDTPYVADEIKRLFGKVLEEPK